MGNLAALLICAAELVLQCDAKLFLVLLKTLLVQKYMPTTWGTCDEFSHSTRSALPVRLPMFVQARTVTSPRKHDMRLRHGFDAIGAPRPSKTRCVNIATAYLILIKNVDDTTVVRAAAAAAADAAAAVAASTAGAGAAAAVLAAATVTAAAAAAAAEVAAAAQLLQPPAATTAATSAPAAADSAAITAAAETASAAAAAAATADAAATAAAASATAAAAAAVQQPKKLRWRRRRRENYIFALQNSSLRSSIKKALILEPLN